MSANESNRRTFLRSLNGWCPSYKQRYIIKGNVNVYCLDFYHQCYYDHSRHLAALSWLTLHEQPENGLGGLGSGR